MKKIYTLALLLICFISQSALYSQATSNSNNIPKGHQLYKASKIKIKQNQKHNPIEKPSQIRDKAADRFYYELDRTCDPMTRKIPNGMYKKEETFIKNKKSLAFSGSTAKKSFSNWVNRGPFNVGGRTRALAIDMNNEDIILAGGVSGGLWRSENGGQSWRKVTRKFQNPSITAIVQDPRPGHQHTWYYGGGERLGNSAGFNASFYTGTGIHKSQDGGRTWELLPASADNTVNAVSPFDIINSMVISPITGDLYIATFNGIYRSQNGGSSFQEVLAGGIDQRTEIAITSQGTLYASIEQTGIFTSVEGTNWTQISENVLELNTALRTIFAINPLNQNEVYMFATDRFGFNELFKYNSTDQTFISLSSQLPDNIGLIGGLVTQGGYNMVLEIHPTNPDFILIGGTNLFRTTDGFRSKIDDTPNHWIGGYSPRNDISLYPDQHPDMHAAIFFPSNPNKVLNANDGGVFITNDITTSDSFEEPVDWISLNNGYITTQPYAVSFDPTSESDELLAGFQDSGTWYTNQTDPNAFWQEEFGGDGAYNAFADNGRTRYVSAQGGNVFRINQDENGNAMSIAWVRPAGFRTFSFVTPFVLDPNNDNVMYLPAGRTLMRNSNLDEIPAVRSIDELTAPTDINWSEITTVESIISQDRFRRELNGITALDVSTFPEANKVYYGTGQGQIYRLDYADLPSSKPVDIFTGKGLPEQGFISSIHVDPNNANRVVISFSNYNIPSVFYTNNAGQTWIDISGNLEENRDGTGNGPSVRWASFLGNRDGILVGTSSGLYYTDRILKENTVWRLENNEIGDGVVMQVRTRKDGLAALAVHGNGVFSKKFDVTPPWGEKTLFVNEKPEDIEFSIEETPQFITLDLSNVFEEELGGPIDITVESSDENRDFIGYEFFNDQLEIYFFGTNRDVPNIDKEGEATIRLTATSGVQKLATEFNVRVFQKSFLDRFDANRTFWPSAWPASQSAEEPFGVSMNEMTDRISIPAGEKWTIERIKILGSADPIIIPFFSIPGERARIRIYEDDHGKPGKQIIDTVNDLNENPVFENDIFTDPTMFGEYDLVLPEKVELTEGKYWISFVRLEEGFFINNITWLHYIIESDDPEYNNEVDAQARGIDLGPPAEDWMPFSDLDMTEFPSGIEEIPVGKSRLIFSLFGEIEDSKSTNAKIPDPETNVSVYPNPTSGLFDIRFKTKLTENISIRIMDISGKEIFTNIFDKSQTNYTIDTSKWAPGIYIAKISGKKTKLTTKIIRK